MAKTVKVYRRKNITHVPYNGACYAPSGPTSFKPGVRVRVSAGDPSGSSVTVCNEKDINESETWLRTMVLETSKKKVPKVKASASAPAVAHVVTVEEALSVLREAGYEFNEKTVVKTVCCPDQIARAIASGNWTFDQARKMQDAISVAGDRIAENARYEFRPGDRVMWTGKHGYTKRGTVKSIGAKNVKVDADDGLAWRVYLGYLRKAS